jgi:hypothetical protein
MTARAMYERQWAKPLETAKQNRNDAVLRLDHAKTAVAEHRDGRSLWQKLMRRPDEELARLQQRHEMTKKAYRSTEAMVQQIEAKWTGYPLTWSKQADEANAPRIALQQQEAQRLKAIRPHVLRECERRDADPVIQQRRADAPHLNYIVAELRQGTDPEEVRDLLLKWRLPNTPAAVKDADRLMAAGMKAHEGERVQMYRDLGIEPPEKKRSGPKLGWSRSRGGGGIERD